MSVDESDQVRETGQDERSGSAGPVQGYTVALSTLALLMLLGAITIYYVRAEPTTNSHDRWVLLFPLCIEVLIALVAALVVAFRVRRSAFAYVATAAFSWFLLINVPIGTAFFIYWFLKVRPRERPA